MGKVPKLRFEGFEGDWEEKRLGEIVERITRKNNDLESELPLTISAQHGLIDQNEFFDRRIASKDVSGYYLIRNGEFAYNKSTSTDAPWGAIKRLDRYEKGVLSTLYIVFRIVDDTKVYSDFLVSYYDTSLWHKDIMGISAEGARNHGLLNITTSDFFSTKIVVAQYKEQRAIGSFLSCLNHYLTLHHRKHAALLKAKQFYLQNLFPRKGEKTPRLRFVGFSGEWEEKKLGDIVERVTRKNQDLESELPLTISAQYGLIDQNEFFDRRIASKDVSGYYLIRNGEFAYNKSTSTDAPWGAIKRLDKYEKGVLSTLYIVFCIIDLNYSPKPANCRKAPHSSGVCAKI